MAKPLPKWCKDVQKKMIDKDIDTSDLAKELGCTRQYVAAIINGRIKPDSMMRQISYTLGVEYEGVDYGKNRAL